MALSPGARLGVFEVTAKIGEGGMGEALLGTDPLVVGFGTVVVRVE